MRNDNENESGLLRVVHHAVWVYRIEDDASAPCPDVRSVCDALLYAPSRNVEGAALSRALRRDKLL